MHGEKEVLPRDKNQNKKIELTREKAGILSTISDKTFFVENCPDCYIDWEASPAPPTPSHILHVTHTPHAHVMG